MTIFVFALSGCENNPAGALMYNGVNDSNSSTWADPFILYSNGDISTLVRPFDAAIGAYTNIWEKYGSSQNILEAQFRGESHTGEKSLKMGWDGRRSETYGTNATVDNVAFWLNTTNTGSSRNLSAAGYTKISFWCKASISGDTEAVINVFGHAYPARDLVIVGNSGWTYYEIDISAYSSNIDTYISVTMQPTGAAPCGGGTLYLDDIRLTK